ncbi:radical SAM protein [Patescibacteria group bacterium]|nr:radical SAM protein [Patescibacteria group bacterium]
MNNRLEKEYTMLEEKLGYYFGRVLSYPLIPPEHVYFSPTNRCNLRCKMCAINKTSDKAKELTTSKIKETICQIEGMGIKHLIFSGGEPLMRDDLLAIAEFAVTHSIEKVDIVTNGVLLNDKIIQKLLEIKLNHITISLDGLEDTNDEIRGKTVFNKAEKNINKLIYYKSKYKSLFPTVGINFTIMDKNINDILPMIEFARANKCNCIIFQPLLSNNIKMSEKRKNDLWPSKENIIKLKKYMQKIIHLKDTLEDFEICTDKAVLEALPGYFKGESPGSGFRCYETIKRIVIGYDGKVWSCVGMYGDLEKKSLKEIWFSQEAMRIRNIVKQCNKHCLQDCVYLPSDILADIRRLFKRIVGIK